MIDSHCVFEIYSSKIRFRPFSQTTLLLNTIGTLLIYFFYFHLLIMFTPHRLNLMKGCNIYFRFYMGLYVKVMTAYFCLGLLGLGRQGAEQREEERQWPDRSYCAVQHCFSAQGSCLTLHGQKQSEAGINASLLDKRI